MEHKYSSLIKSIDLCSTMDLIAVLSDDGTLAVYRTFSWDKIYSKTTTELCNEVSIATLLKFCGNFLAIGFMNGDVAVLNMESLEVAATPRIKNAEIHQTAIVSLVWQCYPLSPLCINGRPHDGLDQVLQCGGDEVVDRAVGESDGKFAHVELMCGELKTRILLSLCMDGLLCGRAFGIYPLFCFRCHPAPLGAPEVAKLVAGSAASMMVVIERGTGVNSFSSAISSVSLGPIFGECYELHERRARLQLYVDMQLSAMQELVQTCARRWKDAVKVVLPKLSLLQSLLDTYQLRMSPVQFMHSVALCGIWHPVASASFTQHWNEAGLSRLNATVDTAAGGIVRALELRARPMVSNLLLACRELLAVQISLSHPLVAAKDSGPSADAAVCGRLLSSCELLAMQLDNALSEARVARDAMLLYIQFIKDCALEATDPPEEATDRTLSKHHRHLRSRYLELFDPRRLRAPGSGAGAHAEHVAGTRLYSFLEDQPAPIATASPVESAEVCWSQAHPDLMAVCQGMDVLCCSTLGILAEGELSAERTVTEGDIGGGILQTHIKSARLCLAEVLRRNFYVSSAPSSTSQQQQQQQFVSIVPPLVVPDGSSCCCVGRVGALFLLCKQSSSGALLLRDILVTASTVRWNGFGDSMLAVVCSELSHPGRAVYWALIHLDAAAHSAEEDSRGYRAVRSCLYVRPASAGGSVEQLVSVMVILEMPSAVGQPTSHIVRRVQLSEWQFTEVKGDSGRSGGALHTLAPAEHTRESSVRSIHRTYPLRSRSEGGQVDGIWVSAERGVVVVATSDIGGRARMLEVLDAEADDEEDETGSDADSAESHP